MRVVGLDGRQYQWTLTGYRVAENDTRPRSSYHIQCRALLKKLYPATIIYEEVPLPGTNQLRLDFYIPRHRLGIEVNGPQHYEQSSLFHESKAAFAASRRRDDSKATWCRQNNIKLVVLKYSETDRWESQLNGREA